MKKINFTCPHCGGHKLIVEKPFQWIQLDVLGLDDVTYCSTMIDQAL
jgi:hypothetical protein